MRISIGLIDFLLLGNNVLEKQIFRFPSDRFIHEYVVGENIIDKRQCKTLSVDN